MSNRHDHERKAIEALREHLRSTGRGDFLVDGEHVPVGRKNCDFVLADAAGASSKIAVEIVRVIDDQGEMENQFFRGVHWEALKIELAALGVTGVLVRTPWRIATPPRETKAVVVPMLARRIKETLDANPHAKQLKVDGHVIVRVTELEGVVPSSNSGAHYVNRPRLLESLLDTLERKDQQLEVDGVERILLALAWNTNLDAEDIVRQLAVRADLHRLRNADRIVFVGRKGAVEEIYTRAVRDYFAGVGAFPAQSASLVSAWFTARLSADSSGSFALVRRTHDLRGGRLDFLRTNAREALAHHGSHLEERGERSNALWILRQLRNDPDPLPEFRASSGSICTVRGTAAWLAHRLAASAATDELSELILFASDFSSDPNVYVREMAGYIIRVLMARREDRSANAFVLPERVRAEIRDLWRRYVGAAAQDGIADAAASTLSFVFDLTEEDVLFAFDSLLSSTDHDGRGELSRLGVYAAFLRPTDPVMSAPFAGKDVRHRLLQLIGNDPVFRGDIAFTLYRSIKDHPDVRPALAPLVGSVLQAGDDERALGFGLECAASLAMDGLLDHATEKALLGALGRANSLDRTAAVSFAYRLNDALIELGGAGQVQRANRWLERVRNADMLSLIDVVPTVSSGASLPSPSETSS